MKSLTLSIIVPVYNEEDYLKNCLIAIQDQTVKPDEVIVVDNNSTDKSAAIAAQFPFVKVVRESSQGIVYARNAGFNAATTDLIGRIDADTVLAPNWVEHVKKAATEIDATTAITGPCTFYDHTYNKGLFWFHRVIYFWVSRVSFGHTILFGSNMFMYRSQWETIKYDACKNNAIHEDMDLAAHIFQSGGTVQFDKYLPAAISSRRFSNWRYYPSKWTRTWTAHGLVPRAYQFVRKVYEGGEY